jgi:hypothetical protein
MAIAVYSNPEALSSAQYDEIMSRLAAAGQASPKGRSHHSAFGPADHLMIYDVWDTQADCDAFMEALMPILAEFGIDVSPPDVMSVHNIVQ